MEAGEEVVNATLASLVRSCLDRGEVDGDNIRNEVNVSCTPANCNGNGNCILGMFILVLQVANPGFPGGNPRGGCANLLFGQIFAENCMKMKEFGPREGRASLVLFSVAILMAYFHHRTRIRIQTQTQIPELCMVFPLVQI